MSRAARPPFAPGRPLSAAPPSAACRRGWASPWPGPHPARRTYGRCRWRRGSAALTSRAMSVPFTRGLGGRQGARAVNAKRADLGDRLSVLVRAILGVALGAGSQLVRSLSAPSAGLPDSRLPGRRGGGPVALFAPGTRPLGEAPSAPGFEKWVPASRTIRAALPSLLRGMIASARRDQNRQGRAVERKQGKRGVRIKWNGPGRSTARPRGRATTYITGSYRRSTSQRFRWASQSSKERHRRYPPRATRDLRRLVV